MNVEAGGEKDRRWGEQTAFSNAVHWGGSIEKCLLRPRSMASLYEA